MSTSTPNPDISGDKQSGQDVQAVSSILKTSLGPVGLDKVCPIRMLFGNLLVSDLHLKLPYIKSASICFFRVLLELKFSVFILNLLDIYFRTQFVQSYRLVFSDAGG